MVADGFEGTAHLWSDLDAHSFCCSASRQVVDGRLSGQWANGQLHGKARFYYPDGTYFRGEWKDGDLWQSSAGYVYDPPSATQISHTPLLSDLYESRTVCVAPSTIKHVSANEGLFAKRAIPAGQLACWYSGVISAGAEVDGRPNWDLNDNVNTHYPLFLQYYFS